MRATRALIDVIGSTPENSLQALAEKALELCGGESAGISIEDLGAPDEIFRWEATTGKLKPFLNGTMPRRFSPCGTVLDRNSAILMEFPERHFSYIENLGIPFAEVLLEPFYSQGKPVGTIWVAVHHSTKRFDLEDQRLLKSLSAIAAIGYQAQQNKKKFAADIQESKLDLTAREEERDESRKQTVFERKEKEAARNETRELLEEREIRERFVNTLTHDLRTPMTAARLTAQLLERHSADIKTTKSLQRITYNLDRADRMIRDLLDANRLQTGDPVSLSIAECSVNEIIESLKTNQAQLGQSIECILPTYELNAYWDRNAVERILENLVGNAVKYGTPKSRVTISVFEENDIFKLSVHNVGNPISENDIGLIFEPFHRLTSAIEGGQKGWGIGLGLVKAFTDAHCGFVEVESSVELGTTFTVSLPRDARKQS